MKVEDVYYDLPTLEINRLKRRKITMEDAAYIQYALNPEVSKYVLREANRSLTDTGHS